LKKQNIFDRAGKNHPLKTMIYFVIAGISMLFFALMALFGFNHPAHVLGGQRFPKAFIISTALILVSSFTIEAAYRAYKRENSKRLLDYLLLTLAIALGFSVAQYFGWKELWTSGITLYSVGEAPGETHTPGGAFLFIISGLHLLHLAVGLLFLFLAMFKAVNVRGDDVRSVLYFTDRLEKTRIEMLARYWHYLGGLWVLLFLYFLWFFV
jgi:cytochrome c oxidase subunit III